ncbi:MAG: DNA oxidative demethylase AlkB [Pseudazoarcus pumilus]|nr:DNA oxidative demethylase AlkB [Pseudazoarcus pumilus]
MNGLFDELAHAPVPFADGAVLLPARARDCADELLRAIEAVAQQAPFRHMHTPGGHRMSVAMTCCGALGWVSDESGYRYATRDPQTGQNWPAMPSIIRDLARKSATEAGFEDFDPDACLINRYVPGARMSLHQDRNERDFAWPIVSISLGLPASFQFGGLTRSERPLRVPLQHGDVVVWGGPARLRYHGILTLKDGHHPLTGTTRFNLTLRRAG